MADGERLVRWPMAQSLGEMGYRVLEAVHAVAMQQQAPNADVILVDDRLPGLSACGPIGAVGGEGWSGAVLLLSANPSLEAAVTAMQQGAWNYVPKPVDPRWLQLLVDRAMETVSLRSKLVEEPGRGQAVAYSQSFSLPEQGVDLELVERSLVEQALARSDGNRTHAAKLLGITRDQMRYRVAKFGL